MEKLVEQLDQIDAKLDQIDADITALLNVAEMTDDLRIQHERLVAEQDRLTRERATVRASIDREQQRLDRANDRQLVAERSDTARRQVNRAAATVARSGALTTADAPTPNGPAPQARQSNPPSPLGTDGATIAGNLSIAEPRYWGTLKSFTGTRTVTLQSGHRLTYTPEQRALRFGMWVLAALGQQEPGRWGRTEACQTALRFVQERMPGANMFVTSTDNSGYQFLIPPEFSRDIIDLREQFGVARRLLKREPMISDKKMIPRRQSGLTAAWTSEGGAIPQSNKIWNDVELIARDLTALSVVSAQVNADTIVPWGDDMAKEIAYAFSLAEGNAAFIGDGSSTYGRIIGVAQKLLKADGTNPSAGLVTATGSGWGGIVLKDFERLLGILPQYADSPACTWLCHRAFFYGVALPLLTALGGVTMTEAARPPFGGTTEGMRARPMLLGYPVEFSQIMPSTTASAQIPITFGDFEAGAAFGDRQQPQIAFSDQGVVAGLSLFERNLLGIRGVERIDINIHDAGTPTLAGPICGLLTG